MSVPNPIERLLATQAFAVADGGMGTLLFERGLAVGGCPELLNVEMPDVPAGIHREYIESGADIILTNTFGGSRLRLEHFDLEHRVDELNKAAVELAASVAATTEKPAIVAGSIGPTGQLFAPLGTLNHELALEVFQQQASALAVAGSDVLWIETMSSLQEVEAAYRAALSTGLPVIVTMSFDTHGKTMMGTAPRELVEWAADLDRPPVAIGANCGIGPEDVVGAVREMNAGESGLAMVAKANCGLPVVVDGAISYPLQPSQIGRYAADAAIAGAGIVGVCCGSTPDHVAAIRSRLEQGDLDVPSSSLARRGSSGQVSLGGTPDVTM